MLRRQHAINPARRLAPALVPVAAEEEAEAVAEVEAAASATQPPVHCSRVAGSQRCRLRDARDAAPSPVWYEEHASQASRLE